MNKLNDLPYQTILFDGKWGIGKTKYIMDSINDKENVYYISLFGKKDINVFYQELYYLLLSKHKVKFKKVKDKIGKINFSQFGFNISIPLISDIFESIQEELENTTNITIIIDDLERKKDEFDIREVFGFVDSITKKEGTKVVLVASSDNFSTETKKTSKSILKNLLIVFTKFLLIQKMRLKKYWVMIYGQRLKRFIKIMNLKICVP